MAFQKYVKMARCIPMKWISCQSNDDVRCFLAEFVGTALLVIFTCGACTSTSSKNDTLVATALSFGLTVTCLVASIGHVRYVIATETYCDSNSAAIMHRTESPKNLF